MKEEFRNKGLSHFPPHKILELLLFYVIPRRDTNEIAHCLMERFGSLTGVFDASIHLLCETEGIGLETATFIKLISSVIREYLEDYASQHNIITDFDSAKEFMRYKFLSENVECLYFAGLAVNGKVLYSVKLAEGSPETIEIAPSSIVRTALRSNSAKVLLAHNHPHGICNPSNIDVITTNVIFSELERVEVELVDHIIVAKDGVISMKEIGMFPREK